MLSHFLNISWGLGSPLFYLKYHATIIGYSLFLFIEY